MKTDKRMILLAAVVIVTVVLQVFCWMAESLAASAEEERTAALIEGAKKEGKVVWYNTHPAIEVDRLLKKFTERYPFLTTDNYRGGSEKLLTKIMGEVQAKRYLFDAVEITAAESQLLLRKGLFAKHLSPQRRFYAEGFKDADGYWTDFSVNLNVIGYNTRLVSRRDVPKTYEDLLHPRWKGKMCMDTKSYAWFASVLKIMGEKKGLEFMKKLGEQDIRFRTGNTLNAQMVAAGEQSLAITSYNHRIEEMKAKGAPVDWAAIEPVVAGIHPLSVSAHAPHPNAARLLVDFLLSKEGQEVVINFYRISSRIDVDPIVPAMKRGLKIMQPDFSLVDDYDKYARLYRELLMRR